MDILRLPLSLLALVLWGAATVDGQLAMIRPVQIGGCYDTSANEVLHCAAVEDDCSDAPGTRFKSAEQLGFAGERACAAATLSVGHCGARAAEDGGPACALTADACADPGAFVPAEYAAAGPGDGGCTARGRSHAVTGALLPTRYGACKDGTTGEVSCLRAPSDCPARSAWVPADVAGCLCRDVRVGLCESSGHGGGAMQVKCALSADDCDFKTFVAPSAARDHPALVDCRLCPDDAELAAVALGTGDEDDADLAVVALDAGDKDDPEPAAVAPSAGEEDSAEPTAVALGAGDEEDAKLAAAAPVASDEDEAELAAAALGAGDESSQAREEAVSGVIISPGILYVIFGTLACLALLAVGIKFVPRKRRGEREADKTDLPTVVHPVQPTPDEIEMHQHTLA